MSASDAYVDWWSSGVDPALLLDRSLDAGLRPAREPGSDLVDLLDEEGCPVPTPLPELRELLRWADGRVTYQVWFEDGDNLVLSRRRLLVGQRRRVVDAATCYLDAFAPEEFDRVVGVMASLLADLPERTLLWALDGSNDTAPFEWAPVAAGEPVAVPWAHVVVTRAESVVTAPGRGWSDDVPAPGLQAAGWPDVAGGDPSWYWWCRR